MAATKGAKGNTRLAALTAAALSLPGISPKSQAADPEHLGIDSQIARYEESGGRMRVDVYQASAFVPINDRFNLKVNGVNDIISGASPVANRVVAGKPVQILSAASIRDVRDSVDVTGNYLGDFGTLGVNTGRSSENDYNSSFFNLDARLDFNQKLTTLALGYGYASDNVWGVDYCPPHCYIDPGSQKRYRRPDVGGEKSVNQALLGLTQILDKNSLVQANLTYTHGEGYLSDPYKAVYTPWVTTPYPGYAPTGYSHDTRPGHRDQFAVLMRYVHNFAALNSAVLHLDYRFYADTWGIDAHTLEATWMQPLLDGWTLSPRVRYYSQNSAEFYQPVFFSERADHHYSSDYRLAGFGAISGGVEIGNEFFGRLRVAGGIDFYRREKGLGLNGGAGSAIDDFSFSMYAFSVNLKF